MSDAWKAEYKAYFLRRIRDGMPHADAFASTAERHCRAALEALWEITAEGACLQVLLDVIGERDRELERMQRKALKS